MAEFQPGDNKIVMYDGKVISVEQAERMVNSLESAIETAREYQNTPEIQDIPMNERAVSHLLDPSDSDHLVRLEISYESEDALATEYFEEVLRKSDRYDHLDARVEAQNVRPFFEESGEFEGFHVKRFQPQ